MDISGIRPEVYKGYRKPEVKTLSNGNHVVHDFMIDEERTFNSKPEALDYVKKCEAYWKFTIEIICDMMGTIYRDPSDDGVLIKDFDPGLYLLEHIHPDELYRVFQGFSLKVYNDDSIPRAIQEYLPYTENKEGVFMSAKRRRVEYEAHRSYTESVYEIFRQGAGDINLGLAASMVDEETIIHDMVERFMKEAKPEKLKNKEEAQRTDRERMNIV